MDNFSKHEIVFLQLDADLLLGGDSEAQMKQAFIEFYKLFDDFGIIDKTNYLNINNEIKV